MGDEMSKEESVALFERGRAAKAAGKFAMRSCWKCNGAHEHLKKSDSLIVCFECGHWYLEGHDLTEIADAEVSA